MTMPGYASGKDGQQQVPLYIPMQEQFIKEVTVDDGTTQGVAIGWDEGGNIIKNDEVARRWKIENPYYFIIKYGGLELPTSVLVKTGTEDGGVDDIYPMDVRWKGASRNILNIKYDDTLIETSFAIDLDGQSYGLTFDCEPYILSNTLLFSSLYDYYGVDEFIDLPINISRHNLAYNIINVDSNGNYNIIFDNGREVSFEDISGSGNRFSFNKWDFSDVLFDDAADVQEATLRLGGIGGQVIRWELTTCSKYTVNYSLQTLYVAKLGQSFDLPADPVNKLPEMITQYFSNNTYKTFKVDYEQLTEPETNYAISYNDSTRVVTAEMKSPAIPVEEASNEWGFLDMFAKPEDVAVPGQIQWKPTTVRAYPSTEEENVGEVIFFSVYEDKGDGNINGTKRTYLRHPDDPDYAYIVSPGLGVDYKYTEGIYVQDGYRSDSYFEGGSALVNIPVLEVKQGTRFDYRNLPIYDVHNYFKTGGFLGIAETIHKQDFTYYMPWSSGASGVRYLAPDQSNAWSYTGSEDTFGDPSSPDEINTSVAGAIYTITTTASVGGTNYKMHCKVVVVSNITH